MYRDDARRDWRIFGYGFICGAFLMVTAACIVLAVAR